MKIPQLVQEIIDDYIYLVPWKARIRQVNIEYNNRFYEKFAGAPLIERNNTFTYNWRNLQHNENYYSSVYGGSAYAQTFISNVGVAKLPSRYFYSNTKEQLKSLYF